MLNKINIMGRLVRDPEMRQTQNGIDVASFTLAVDRDYKDQSGERKADFIDCTAWRNTAQYVQKWFQKGRMAIVHGRLQSKKWVDRDGNNRTSWEVVVDDIYFGDSKRSEGAGNSTPSADYSSGPDGNDFAELTDDDGELPFNGG